MKRSIVALLSLAIVASCGDDNGTGPGDLAANGAVSFSYNGGALLAAGTYTANGGMPLNPSDQENRTWSAGYRDPSTNNDLGVVATVARSDRFDFAVLAFDRGTPGTSTIDTETCDAEVCAAMIFWYNLSEATNASGEILCGLNSGTMTIATVTSTRATGTFSGTGSCLSLDGETMTESDFTVTNGSFDVPLVQDVPGGANLRVMRAQSRR